MFSPTCPLCGALIGPESHGGASLHAEWHYATRTLVRWSTDEIVAQVREQRRLAELVGPADAAETLRLPPIGETVRRRPPVPPPAEVRELRGAELLRALAEELDREDLAELDHEDDDQ